MRASRRADMLYSSFFMLRTIPHGPCVVAIRTARAGLPAEEPWRLLTLALACAPVAPKANCVQMPD